MSLGTLGSVTWENGAEEYAPPVPAKNLVDSLGYSSLFGVAPDSAVLDNYATPEDAPQDGKTRIFKDADGTQRFMQNGVEVYKIEPKEKRDVETKRAGGNVGITAWQKRLQERKAKSTGASEVVCEETETTWWLKLPGMSAMAGLQAVQSTVKIDEETGDPILDGDWFGPYCAAMFAVFVVTDRNDATPYFASIDEAKEFVDDGDFFPDALSIFSAIQEKFGAFLSRTARA